MDKDWIMLALPVALIIEASSVQARQLECTYDHITHVHVMRLTETAPDSGKLDSVSWYDVSPTGGQELYLFDMAPTPKQHADNSFVGINSELFYRDWGDVDGLYLIDFERAVVKELQFPGKWLREPGEFMHQLVEEWECRRLD